ncbi:MAG TPA: RHS repeat-associated core domain-containing protein, partial [Chitinolyticbacter sp.]|nr:RHS repeat-associated core domain-containing protein [Chitinolyticbacter sp.]
VSDTTLFTYDEAGQTVGEYDATGQRRTETVWLDNIPVAVVQGAGTSPKLYYVWADHLNTPRQLTDAASNKLVWEWTFGEPFGNWNVNEDRDNDGVKLTYNLRFPGQYFDKEIGRHYNYFRDYDPRIGRYIQSDPIGLAGGINTYGYAFQSPLKLTDTFGLSVDTCTEKCKPPRRPTKAATIVYLLCRLISRTDDSDDSSGGSPRPPKPKKTDPPPIIEPHKPPKPPYDPKEPLPPGKK